MRLYSGPAYQLINGFLRQVARLDGAHRVALARSLALSFAATVGHVCRAIRKLAAIATPEEAAAPLYRGVRGELPNSFWVADEQGLVCATDTAFMSTSRNRKTPIEYMGGGTNVLWELEPKVEDDTAYHNGAPISMLSQFAEEDEVLYPPCTMLRVKRRDEGESSVKSPEKSPSPGKNSRLRKASTVAMAFSRPSSSMRESDGGGGQAELQVVETREEGKSFVAIRVEPAFV